MNRTHGADWFKSSYSYQNGDCVEIMFVRSSYSGQNGACVEVAHLGDAVALRDSKRPGGPILTSTVGGWRAFIAGVVNAELGEP